MKEETDLAENDALWHNKARLVNGKGKVVNFHELGFSEKDRCRSPKVHVYPSCSFAQEYRW